jgi:ribonuclease HII
MKRAVERLSQIPDYVFVDAMALDLPIAQRALIRGDARCFSIAAASILAKVHRDAKLQEWDSLYPDYGLGRHKGYATPEHLDALQRLGPTPQHRFSFEPVRRYGLQMPLFRASAATIPGVAPTEDGLGSNASVCP